MKIGIDARFYGPKQKGLGRYVQKLVENLEKVDLSNQYIIFLRKENWPEYQPANPRFKKALADYQWYSLKEQILMPFKIRRSKVDLIHFPHFNLPIFCFKPFVVTIHDLVLKRFPTRRASTLGPFLYWLKNLAYRLVVFLAVKRAKKIIAVSNYTKKDILRYFRIKPEKIEVVYEGTPELRTRLKCKNLFSEKRFYISGASLCAKPYLLYVGNAYPHKNLERLILAFAKLVKDKQMDCQLVLVGELDYFYRRLQEQFSSVKGLFFTDFVSDKELAALYQSASLYVFPSLGEGFGLPPLEAMTYGLPVVSSRAACLPEILGQAAVYFDPTDIEDMAEKIKQVLKDKRIREKLIDQGFRRIQEYSWSKMARETLEIYSGL